MTTYRKRLFLGLATTLAGSVVMMSQAQATPAFARQMEMNCMGCHTQALTTLKPFGRQFKLTGFTMANGNKSMITGGALGTSVPLAINAGVGIKSNYVMTDQPGVRNNLSFPGGSAIFVGGKIAEGFGANTLWATDGLIHMQTTFTRPAGNGRIGASVYSSQGHGAFISTEAYNTGLHKELAMFENVIRTNAAQATGVGSGPATGLTAFYGGHGLTVTGGLWAQGFNSVYSNKGLDSDGIDQTMLRIAYDLPAMAAWNMTLGAYGLGGSTTGTPCKLWENTAATFATCTGTPWANTLTKFETDAKGFDLQLQGAIAGMETQLVLNHVADYKNKISDVAAPLTIRSNKEIKATSIEARMMVMPAFGVGLGYMKFDDRLATNLDYNTRTIGLFYNYAENVRFSLERSSINYKPAATADFSETTVQMLLAF